MKIWIHFLNFHSSSFGANRIKDIVTIKGVRDNPLIGYGLVIGLNGTGDSGGEITNNSLKKMFATLGLDPVQEVSSANVAAVIVTAKLPSFASIGQKLDVTISQLVMQPHWLEEHYSLLRLKGAMVRFMLANGALSIGGLKQGAKFATTAAIPDGAIVESEIGMNFNNKNSIRMALNEPDFTTAARVVKPLIKT